ncbi:MAG: PQQ-binding-like beta-propeller repeat protein [Phycisphaerae bacterium]
MLNRRRPLVLTLLILAGCMAVAQDVQADWPQFLGPNRTGQLPDAQLSVPADAKLPEVWTKQIGIGYSSFAVLDGKLYTMGNEGNADVVYCLKADTGEQVWTYKYPTPMNSGGYYGPRSTPAVDETGVYTLSHGGLLHCLDPADGSVKWKKDLSAMGMKPPRWGFSGSALLADEVILLDMGPVIALKKADGEVAWKSRPKPPSYSSPIEMTVGGKNLLATFDGSGLTIVEPGSGREMYSFTWKTPYGVHSCTPIAVGDDKVFISSGYRRGGALLDLSGSGAKEIWTSRDLGAQCNNPVLIDGYLYGFDGNVGGRGTLLCMRVSDGKVMWEKKDLGVGSLIAAGKTLLVLGEHGKLVVAKADPSGFEPIASREILGGDYCWTPPVLVGNKLYARNYIKARKISELVCIDLSK